MSGCELLNQRFGLLTVTEKMKERQDRYIIWRCRCDCGQEILVNTKKLKRGTITNCGCVSKPTMRMGPIAENLQGRVFGKLTVLCQAESKNRRTRWLCRCECGNEKVVNTRELKYGKTKSCGCERYRRGRVFSDLCNQRFGRLTVLYCTERRDRKSSVCWYCRCDCGNELEITSDRLVYGNYRSCGCLKKENQQMIFDKLHMVDGTCVEWLEKRKYRKDNTSGFRGVDRIKNGKYRVTIGFKKQRFYLGVFDSFEEAVQMRLEAEEQIHVGFVEAYYEWKEKAELDPAWAGRNAFTYEVQVSRSEVQINRSGGEKKRQTG